MSKKESGQQESKESSEENTPPPEGEEKIEQKVAEQPKEFMVDGEKVTPGMVKQWKKDAQNVKNMNDEMNRMGERIHGVEDQAKLFQDLRQKYGDEVLKQMLMPVERKSEYSPLLPPIENEEDLDPTLLRFENDRHKKISDFAKQTNDQIKGLQQQMSVIAANLFNQQTMGDEQRFASDHNVDLSSNEGKNYMKVIRDFGQQNNCFELRGPEGHQHYHITREGLEAAYMLHNLSRGREALQSGDTQTADMAIKNLLGGSSGLQVRFEPTPSRQGETQGIDINPLIGKMQAGKLLSKIELDTLKQLKDDRGNPLYYLPQDFPTAD